MGEGLQGRTGLTTAALGLVAVASALWLAAPAQAATAQVDTAGVYPSSDFPRVQIDYFADPGEKNRPSFTFQLDGKEVVISDPGVPITPGNGCVPLGLSEVLCDSTAAFLFAQDATTGNVNPDPSHWRFRQALVFLGDGNDNLVQPGPGPDYTVYGGPGDDLIKTGDGNDALYGETGDDRLRSGAGDDTLRGGTGADDMQGGPGNDEEFVFTTKVPFEDTEPDLPRTISLDDVANDGTVGEGDNVHSDIENVTVTGDSPNTLIGNDGPNWLQGGSGDDAIKGLGGADWLQGGSGNDQLDGGAGADRIQGLAGDDVIAARDGEADTSLDCGDGNDQLAADLIDPPSIGCEQDNRG